MPNKVFLPADILLPAPGTDMTKWSVVACDQFTSEPEYWDSVDAFVGDSPSTLRLMLPEAYFSARNMQKEIDNVTAAMEDYLRSGVFTTVHNSYIYLERQLSGGSLRRGLIGILDLEAYDYRSDGQSLVHATEETVEDRLPPRVKVRERAPIELPHIGIFIDDAEHTVIDPIIYTERTPELLYDFDLMQGGGRIRGWRVNGANAQRVERALGALAEPDTLARKYGKHERAPVVFAVGDGNHSLATAKLCWERIKAGLTPEQQKNHPARYSLAELMNLHDSSINFEPIHRVIFHADTDRFIAQAQAFFSALDKGGPAHNITLLSGGERRELAVGGLTLGELIGAAEQLCMDYTSVHGGAFDYIHGDNTAAQMAASDGCCGILLPKMDKFELFPSIIKSGVFPRKSFSVGHSRDKRYYLECRKIK